MGHHFLEIPQLSYIVGFLQADGHHQASTRNRGKITVEIQALDKPLLEDFQSAFTAYSRISERTRDTNFKDAYTSCCWALYDRDTREALLKFGVPVGAKSETIVPPTWDFSPRDYFRGLVDGDGSLGYTEQGLPFVSLTTKSESIALAYTNFLSKEIGYLKRAVRNKRDQIFNLLVTKEHAQRVAQVLYTDSTLRLERKHTAYLAIMQWVRPEGMVRRGPKNWWTPEQDKYVSSHTIDDAMLYLRRSRRSVTMRRFRLLGGGPPKPRTASKPTFNP